LNSPAQKPNFALDRARIDAVIEPIARAHGAELVDVEFKSDQGGWVLRVFVEKLGSAEKQASVRDAAVDLELCANVARDLSPALDVADPIPHRYSLEVSSPGVERALRGEADYIRFAGQKARIKVHQAVAGQKVLVGVLTKTEDSKLFLKDGSRTFEIALSNIAAARLVFEFGQRSKSSSR
jgi:ribosome maturation factor RimP